MRQETAEGFRFGPQAGGCLSGVFVSDRDSPLLTVSSGAEWARLARRVEPGPAALARAEVISSLSALAGCKSRRSDLTALGRTGMLRWPGLRDVAVNAAVSRRVGSLSLELRLNVIRPALVEVMVMVLASGVIVTAPAPDGSIGHAVGHASRGLVAGRFGVEGVRLEVAQK